ncbi:hypothetical protein EDB83DRAFT_2452353 [Lactarius deliciosus]|nr:hypothetical protein EDB83DRAFT_2452353 [Lactarius deliciosus]
MSESASDGSDKDCGGRSLRKPGFGMPPSSAAVTLRSGADVSPGEMLGVVAVGGIFSRTGSEADNEGFGGSEDVRRPGLCWRATTVAVEAEERGGVDVEVSGVQWSTVKAEVTTSRISPAVVGSGDVTRMRRPAVVVWRMGRKLSSGGTSVRLSTT